MNEDKIAEAISNAGTSIWIGLMFVGVAIIMGSCHANGAELSTFYTAEHYNRTGEVKSGFGLRARHYFTEHIGVELQAMSLTPRDSIIDRSDLSLCWRQPATDRLNIVGSAGLGANFEDNEKGLGAGVHLQYEFFNDWFAESGARIIQEKKSKTLLTIGIGRKF